MLTVAGSAINLRMSMSAIGGAADRRSGLRLALWAEPSVSPTAVVAATAID
jgi:hypothetical protein